MSQARSSRAKTKHGQDKGSVNGSAIRATEDAAGRRFAAARAEAGSTDRTRAILKTHATVDLTGQNGKTFNTTPAVANSCKKKGKKHHKAHRGHRG